MCCAHPSCSALSLCGNAFTGGIPSASCGPSPSSSPSPSPSAAAELSALMDLYSATNGAAWTNNSGWGMGDPCFTGWYGVVCDSTHSHITELWLGVNNLSGSLPASLAALRHIVYVTLLGFSERHGCCHGYCCCAPASSSSTRTTSRELSLPRLGS